MSSTAMAWCRARLPEVSRSFALGIQSLPEPYEAWITVGYLLCRVVDTVEDNPHLSPTERQALFEAFRSALDGGEVTPFLSALDRLGESPDVRVCRGLDRVLSLMETFPTEVVLSLRTWVGEMTRGMALYASRRARVTGRVVLRDVGDLDRYCYFVAGTVGHLLTDLFCLGSPRIEASREELTRHAEGFALLLQLTNIAKDVAEDWERGFCFLPSSLLASEGIPEDALLDEAYQEEAQGAVDSIVDLARLQATSAVAYVQTLAPEAIGPRRFCLFPMLLALRTLDLAQGNPAVLQPGSPVKVSRESVAEALVEMESLLTDESALAAFDPRRRVVREVV